MDPPQINFVDYNSVLVINPAGKMRQLFTPFKVLVLQATDLFSENSMLIVDEIRPHDEHRLLYHISGNWWPYHIFLITISF
jgi:hypothetical protein